MRPKHSSWLIGAALLCGCPSSPGGQVADESKTPECSAELKGALEAVKRDLGFGFDVVDDDGATLMNRGGIAKRYARDGVKVSLQFGLDPGDGACSLVAYKMTRSEPGRTTTSGTKARVPLSQCTCIAGTK